MRSSEKSRLQREKLKLLSEDRNRVAAQTYQFTVMKNLRCMEKKHQDAMIMKKAQESHVSLFCIFCPSENDDKMINYKCTLYKFTTYLSKATIVMLVL